MVTETVLKIIGEENVSGQPTFTEKMAVKNAHIQTDNKLSVILKKLPRVRNNRIIAEMLQIIQIAN